LIGRTTGKKGIPNPKHSEWMKENNPFKGKTHSDEHKLKLKESNSKPKSEEHKRKISETLKGNKPGNMRKITINNVSYESLSEAARQLGLSLSTVKNRLKSNSKKFINWNYE
jgi:DNA-directed RNA polymerase specialized sigma24 family protein